MNNITTPKAKRLRTWSAFGDIRRVPSEYEVVTHDMNYTLRKGRVAALESNPTTPANMWYQTYRDKSPVQVDEWNDFRDPDEITYRKYVTIQDEQETVVEGILDEYAGVSHDEKIPQPWLNVLAHSFVPTRYLVHGLQMTQAYLGMIAPSSYITNCASFSAADLLRRGSLVAYRTKQLEIAQPDAAILRDARKIWETHADWQPARKSVEQALIAYDWAECLTAVNLVLRPALDEVLLSQLAAIARENNDELTWLLLTNLANDSQRAIRWSTALARFAIERNPDNAKAFHRWADRWMLRAEEAIVGLAAMLARLPESGQDESETVQAAVAAVTRTLTTAGIKPVLA